jgi:hypothetical protein
LVGHDSYVRVLGHMTPIMSEKVNMKQGPPRASPYNTNHRPSERHSDNKLHQRQATKRYFIEDKKIQEIIYWTPLVEEDTSLWTKED